MAGTVQYIILLHRQYDRVKANKSPVRTSHVSTISDTKRAGVFRTLTNLVAMLNVLFMLMLLTLHQIVFREMLDFKRTDTGIKKDLDESLQAKKANLAQNFRLLCMPLTETTFWLIR